MKKSNYILYFTILIVGLTINQTTFADGNRKTGGGNDVKIKTRQTMSGRTFENTTYIKGKRQRAEQNTGGMQTVNLTQCDLKRGVRLMPQSQTFMIDVWQAAEINNPPTTTGKSQPTTKGGLVTSTVTTKDTGERKQMFGYTAKHIITTMEMKSSPDACNVTNSKMQFDGWYIDAAFALDCETGRTANYRPPISDGGCQDRYETKQTGAAVKKGYPVWEKMLISDESGKEISSMLNEVVELSKATLDAALFEVPGSYREVKNASELYASMANSNSANANSTGSRASSYIANSDPSDSAMSKNVQNLLNPSINVPIAIGAKKAGAVRIGLANVKTGSIGEGLSAAELAGAVQNTLSEYLKSPNVEIVALEAKLPSAIETEAVTKSCDYVLFANVSHKKGGSGGFGMFKKLAPALGNVAPLAGVGGSIAGAVAGQVASTAIYTAANLAGNVKSKDELTLDIKVSVANGASAGGTTALARQFKQKAKSDGDDIISPIIEQVAQAILDVITKK